MQNEPNMLILWQTNSSINAKNLFTTFFVFRGRAINFWLYLAMTNLEQKSKFILKEHFCCYASKHCSSTCDFKRQFSLMCKNTNIN